MSQSESFHGWLRSHFKLDQTDLAEIQQETLMPDVDTEEVMSLLADDFGDEAATAGTLDDVFVPKRLAGAGAAWSSFESSPLGQPAAPPAAGAAGEQETLLKSTAERTAQYQHLQQPAWQPDPTAVVAARSAAGLTMAPSSSAGMLQGGPVRHMPQQQQQAGQVQHLGNAQQQLLVPQLQLQLQQQPQQHQEPFRLNLQQMQLQPLFQAESQQQQQQQNQQQLFQLVQNQQQLLLAMGGCGGAGNALSSMSIPVTGAETASAADLDAYPAQVAESQPAAAAPPPAAPSQAKRQSGRQAKKQGSKGSKKPSSKSSSSGVDAGDCYLSPKAAAGRSSSSSAGAGGTDAAAGGVAGVGKRRKRAPSEAQRQAHRRFRQRRKAHVATLVAEVEAKQAQLQALSVEHAALSAKARALDQLVASADSAAELLQQLQRLDLEEAAAAAAQQQPVVEVVEPSGKEGAQQQQKQAGTAHTVCAQKQSAEAAAAAGSTSSSASAACKHETLQDLALLRPDQQAWLQDKCGSELQQLLLPPTTAQMQQHGLPGGAGIGASSSSGLQVTGARAAGIHKVGSIEHLQAAMQRVLSVTSPTAGQQQQQLLNMFSGPDSSHIAPLQSVLKQLLGQIMQMLLEISNEQQLLLLQPADGFSLKQLESLPAVQRLQYVVNQVRAEFRKFCVGNRLSIYKMHTLNIDTGVVGVQPPPCHWAKVAQLMRDKLSPQVLADLCVARQLYSSTVMRIKQQRQLLVLQLQQLLERYTGMGAYSRDCVVSDVNGPHGEGRHLLDAIDSNLRREYVLEGIHQWMFMKLVPPLLAAEMLVQSYPYLVDSHAVMAQLSADPQHESALSAWQDLQQQQQQQQLGGMYGAKQQLLQQGQWAVGDVMMVQQQPVMVAAAATEPTSDRMMHSSRGGLVSAGQRETFS